jgi:hypothetical protein
MNRGLLTMHTGVCIGLAASVVLAMFVAFGSEARVEALFFGMICSLPYLVLAISGACFRHSRCALWLLLGGVTLLGGAATLVRYAALHTVLNQEATMRAAMAAGRNVKWCGPPPVIFAFLLGFGMSGFEFTVALCVLVAYLAFD